MAHCFRKEKKKKIIFSARHPKSAMLWEGSRQGKKGDEEVQWVVMRTLCLHRLCESNCDWAQRLNRSKGLWLSTNPTNSCFDWETGDLNAATHGFCWRRWEEMISWAQDGKAQLHLNDTLECGSLSVCSDFVTAMEAGRCLCRKVFSRREMDLITGLDALLCFRLMVLKMKVMWGL